MSEGLTLEDATPELQAPAVTISLVTWNGLRWLPGCLDSVAAQTIDDYELLILDNGSADGSVEWLRERAAADRRIRLLESGVNLGFARAHNRNVEAARGAAVLLLNQDVVLDPGFLAAAVAVLAERSEVGSVQGRLRRLSPGGECTDVLDTTGLEMHRDRRVVSRGQLLRDGGTEALPAGPVWGVDGAAPLFRRAALESAALPRTGGATELLDEDFFAYKEDVDLAWRLRRLGWSAWYEPAALAWHARGGGDTGASAWRDVARANMSNPPRVRSLSWRNQRLMQVKNEEPAEFLRDLPWIALRELQSWVFILLADPRRLSAVPELVRLLPGALRKRRALTANVRRARPGGEAARASRSMRMRSRLLASRPGRLARHVSQRGLRRTLRRVGYEISERWWLARHPAHRAVPVREVEPGRIQGRLDRPRIGELEVSDYLYVTGWAQSSADIGAVDVYLDGALVKAAHVGRSRPDVASTWRHLDEQQIAGLSAVVPIGELGTGAHVVSVAISDGAGHRRVLARRFRRIEPAEAYRRFHEATSASAGPVTEGGRSLAVRIVVVDDEVGDLASALADEPDERRLLWFLRPGEVIAPTATAELADAAERTGADVVYADHDTVDDAGQHAAPWFVPDWSPYRLMCQDYIGGAFVVRDSQRLRDALDPLGPDVHAPVWRYRLLLAVTEDDASVAHVPRVLWSRPERQGTADADAEVRAVEEALQRRGEDGVTVAAVEASSAPARRITWPTPKARPVVSIIIPTTGRRELAEGTVRLLAETAYAPTETIVLDNGRGRHPDGIALLRDSGATVITRDEPFNWARLNNAGAAEASGELLLFLNDDMEVIDGAWLEALVRIAVRPDAGAVGPLLLYPDGMIQHAGIITVGHGGGAAHMFAELDSAEDLYLDQQRLTREVSALTGACLLVRRDVFEEVGGFDERFVVSGNDTDFCLRVADTGRANIWTPDSVLVHHEGRSRRGVDYLADEGRLWDRWSERLRAGDPCFNPNLAQDRLDCSLDGSRIRY